MAPTTTSEVVHVRARSRWTARGRPAWTGLLALVLAVGLTGCGVTRGDTSRDLDMLIPNSPGGGYDQTGRAAVAAMEDADITGGSFTVQNIIGAGGSAAMATLMGRSGDEQTMMIVGLGVVGSLYSFGSDFSLQDTTPLARLITESEGVLVPGDSEFETIDDLAQAWTDDPGSITVGGGSSPGGPDHLFPMQLASTLGIDAREVNYVSYDGGGPLTSALLGDKIQVGFSGLAEFEDQIRSGELRVLAVSGEERNPQEALAEVPTLTESGIDLVFVNWRGVLAPPDISAERRDQLVGYLQQMRDSPQWQDTLDKRGWTDAFITGQEFDDFLVEQDDRVSTTLDELGLI